MVATFSLLRASEVKADYDRLVDVLYIFMDKIVPVEGDGLPRGVELDWALDGGGPCGVTVIGYERNGWPESPNELAEIAGGHLSLPREMVLQTIRSAVS